MQSPRTQGAREVRTRSVRHRDRISARGLGLVEALVGELQELRGQSRLGALQQAGDTDADRYARMRPVRQRYPKSGHRVLDALRQSVRVEAGGGPRQDRELFSPVAGEDVLGTQRAPDLASDRSKHVVAGGVAMRVVYDFEVIDVDEKHSHLLPVPLRVGHLGIEALLEERAVERSGER